MAPRSLPNIAICGVPGTGKSTLAGALSDALGSDFRILNGNTESEKRGCRLEYDEALQTWQIDEDKLRLALQPELAQGGCIVDWIHADFLVPGDEEDAADEEDNIDLIIQMRAETATLFDRLKARGYSEKKIEENLDAEIMDEIGEEVREVFDPVQCVVLKGEEADREQNLQRVVAWAQAWREEHGA